MVVAILAMTGMAMTGMAVINGMVCEAGRKLRQLSVAAVGLVTVGEVIVVMAERGRELDCQRG